MKWENIEFLISSRRVVFPNHSNLHILFTTSTRVLCSLLLSGRRSWKGFQLNFQGVNSKLSRFFNEKKTNTEPD